MGAGAGGGTEEEVAVAGGGRVGAGGQMVVMVVVVAARVVAVAAAGEAGLGFAGAGGLVGGVEPVEGEGGGTERAGAVHGFRFFAGLGVAGELPAGGTADATVEAPGDDATPGKDGQAHEAQEGTHDDEDGALGEVGLLHERGLGRVGHDLGDGADAGDRG